MATDLMSISRHARITRTAISPRLAMRTLENMSVSYGEDGRRLQPGADRKMSGGHFRPIVALSRFGGVDQQRTTGVGAGRRAGRRAGDGGSSNPRPGEMGPILVLHTG